MITGSGHVSVPPGFRFHPTDEELLYYYLKKKVNYEDIDLDVIRDVDLNKLEPWDLKDKCRIGNGPQNEWYFFSHKDKKYPTGTRTNRATTAGFWKATGRDKAIHMSNSKRIGMRKTLVFYTGRAPHGQKTDWIMHEYRLDDDFSDTQEDGWVVCRVFKKKNQQRVLHFENPPEDEGLCPNSSAYHEKPHGPHSLDQKHAFHMHQDFPYDHQSNTHHNINSSDHHHPNNFNNSMHLPQLLSPDNGVTPYLAPSVSINMVDIECSQNLMKLTSNGAMQQQDWSFLDRLLASHPNLDLFSNGKTTPPPQLFDANTSIQKFPFHYLGCDPDALKFSK
ncbi:hypothetical protein AMTRI_Chr01g134730 [Amborella trichopoda]|uniref:NAC domain-containing protein n=1 Tax=Amborella trichopoda TaxID=13333 RepID=U5DGG1_AMBTC|nr:NAC domain-containing protein 76 [Amborella trichopoda]XP_020532125.1 NAC domain-containing protein 76 [Amborella trichopoda]XP_020532126.1 NAC domain-containing protein 76 [Amborella trichopoda]ERN20552.1 hypothetical protein AMTR_s00068p00207380 [Amborella trichopoda]|eukprot:XP_020532124.1 NAC domain-containing protein 76 [Amborella trichopoda]